MENTTLSSYKQEFLDFALKYKELANVPFSDTPIADQKIFGIKLSTIDYLGLLTDSGVFEIRDDFLAQLVSQGYNPDNSIVVDVSFGYDETCTCDRTDCHNVYSLFSCKDTPAATYLKDKVTEIIGAGASEAQLDAVIDEWLLIPLLTTKYIDAKNVFVVIPEFADESYYSSIITI